MELYKFKSIHGDGLLHCLDAIVNERLFLSNCENLNDPREGAWNDTQTSDEKYIENTAKLRNIVDTVKFTSFTCSCYNELLWAHYAGGFKGIALKYNLNRKKFDIREMNYEGVPNLSNAQFSALIEKTTKPQDCNILLSKSKCWVYEKEYRLFAPEGHQDQYIQIKAESIVFGKHSYDDVLRQIAKKFSIKVEFYDGNG